MDGEREKFYLFVVEMLGLHALAEDKLSHYDVAWIGWQARASIPSAQPSDVVECKRCDDLLDTLAVLPPSTAALCKRGLDRAMDLLKPFDDDGLSLGLGKNALDPIKDALAALTTQQAQNKGD